MEQLGNEAWFTAAGWPAHPIRVQLGDEARAVSCLLESINGDYLVLDLAGTSRKAGFRSGQHVTVRVTHQGQCVEAETRVRQCIWGPAPQLIVGPVHGWRETGERAATRVPQVAGARLDFTDGRVMLGRTRDISSTGVLLELAGAGPDAGTAAHLTLELNGEFWCEDLPVRIARTRHRIGTRGRVAEVAVRIEPRNADDEQGWAGCVARLQEPEVTG